MALLQRGEVTFVKYIRKAEKLLRKNKLIYEYEDGVFYLYAEVFGSEYYRTLTLYVEDGCYILNNGDFTYQYYCAEYSDLQELIDYIFVNYASKYKNGLILTR
jgi:hypothetical protein